MAHDSDSAAQRLERLRHLRIPRERDDSVAGVFKSEGTRLARLDRKVGGIAEAWESVCPADCAPRTRVVGIAKGILTIGVADAATRWHLERLLRSGADRDIVSRCPMTVRRIRLIADAEAADPHESADSPAS